MKTIITHVLAVAIGVLAALVFRPANDGEKNSPEEDRRTGRVGRGVANPITPLPAGAASHIDPRSLEAQLPRKITIADLEPWLEAKKHDPHSLAMAQAIAGLLTDNPDLIRKSIEADPGNAHLLYIGATLPSFTADERLAFGERFFKQDTRNGLAAYIHAAHLLERGDAAGGIEVLRSSADRPRIDDFTTETQLLMDDAHVAAGYPPGASRMLSLINLTLPYYSQLQVTARSIHDLGGSLPPDQAADLRSLTATMGMRLAEQSRSGTFINHLAGLKLEEQSLAGMADHSPSPYEGLTAGQARQSIADEREELRQAIGQAPGLDVILSSPPDLVDRYIERFRLMGELEATKWWLGVMAERK